MTTITMARRARPGPTAPRPTVPLPPLSPRLQIVRGVLVFVVVLSVSLVLDLVVISRVQQRAAQQRAYEGLRLDLARGTAPLGPAGSDGRELRRGTPVAFLSIPSIDLKQVVVEGTSAGQLFTGPGHRRDTALPGQAGVSIVLGRKGSYGGPFGDIHTLRKGATIRVTTGQGAFTYRVIRVRKEKDPAPPPPPAGAGRLLLVTAAGRPFLPSGVVRVDADLTGPAAPLVRRAVTSATLPASEQIMAGDTSTLWALALWLQCLLAVVVGSAWAWHRWGRARAWVICFSPLLLVGLATSGEAARLLPNLL